MLKDRTVLVSNDNDKLTHLATEKCGNFIEKVLLNTAITEGVTFKVSQFWGIAFYQLFAIYIVQMTKLLLLATKKVNKYF